MKPSKTSSRSDEQQQKKMLKLASAAAYRQKILASTATESATTQYGTQKKGKQLDEEEDGYRSPGYYRERDSDKAKVQQQKEAEKRAAGNATFSQCVFNMANILMVSITKANLIYVHLFTIFFNLFSHKKTNTMYDPIFCIGIGCRYAGTSLHFQECWLDWRIFGHGWICSSCMENINIDWKAIER